MKRSKVFSGLFVALLFVVAAQTALAQSTIFNIPSTDTVDKGKGYFEFDFLPQTSVATGAERAYIYNPRLVVGLPNNAEAGVNFFTFHQKGSSPATSGYIQPNFKWKFYKNDDAGVALSAGILWNTPLNNRSAQDSWGYVYANVSKKVKTGNYGPRFTAGPYGVLGANQDPAKGPISFAGRRAGVILGYEQPVHPKASIVADWFSQENGLGYFTPGMSFTLPANGLLNIGYSLGNDSYDNKKNPNNRFLFVYYGITF